MQGSQSSTQWQPRLPRRRLLRVPPQPVLALPLSAIVGGPFALNAGAPVAAGFQAPAYLQGFKFSQLPAYSVLPAVSNLPPFADCLAACQPSNFSAFPISEQMPHCATVHPLVLLC